MFSFDLAVLSTRAMLISIGHCRSLEPHRWQGKRSDARATADLSGEDTSAKPQSPSVGESGDLNFALRASARVTSRRWTWTTKRCLETRAGARRGETKI